MKTFIRSTATYQAEAKQMDDDLEITDLFNEKSIVFNLPEETAFETHIAELHKRIDDLTALVKAPKKNNGSSKKVATKPVVKKAAVKKKNSKEKISENK